MSISKHYPTADLLDERHSQARGWHLSVRRAREAGQPIFHVRSATGTTLDMVATIQEARGIQSRNHGSSVLALTELGQRRINT